MTIKKRKIGIMGIGVVGKAVSTVMPGAILYDKYKKIGSIEEINNADVIFICVPTPYRNGIGFDLSAVREAFSLIKGEKIVVIKSTVLPGTTERIQKKYPQQKILFNPEFLREKSAEKEMKNPSEQIMGYTTKSKPIAKEILEILPNAPAKLIMPATEAEMIKYFFNTFLATKVIFANQIYDLCQELNINYDLIKKIAKISPRLAFSHFDVWTDGYRGYAGKCLPKDIKSLIQLGNKVGVNLRLLKLVDKINEELLKKEK